jgi:hypothetical protein
MRGLLWGIPLIILLAGCSDSGTAEKATGSQDVTVDEEPAPTVFDPMIGTMDEAAAVEDLSMDRKAEMDRAIDGS